MKKEFVPIEEVPAPEQEVTNYPYEEEINFSEQVSPEMEMLIELKYTEEIPRYTDHEIYGMLEVAHEGKVLPLFEAIKRLMPSRLHDSKRGRRKRFEPRDARMHFKKAEILMSKYAQGLR